MDPVREGRDVLPAMGKERHDDPQWTQTHIADVNGVSPSHVSQQIKIIETMVAEGDNEPRKYSWYKVVVDNREAREGIREIAWPARTRHGNREEGADGRQRRNKHASSVQVQRRASGNHGEAEDPRGLRQGEVDPWARPLRASKDELRCSEAAKGKRAPAGDRKGGRRKHE